MNIKIGSFLNLWADIISRKTIHRLRFKITPFIVREFKIGNLFNLTGGITYVKILKDPIPEIIPKIEVDIKKVSLSELLNSGLSNLNEFFPYTERQRTTAHKDNRDYFIAVKNKKLIYCTTLVYARGNRLMIYGTKTLEYFRGSHINPAVLVYIMKHLKEIGKIDRVYISTSGTNISMEKSILRAGFKIDNIFYNFLLFKERIEPIQFLRNLGNGCVSHCRPRAKSF